MIFPELRKKIIISIEGRSHRSYGRARVCGLGVLSQYLLYAETVFGLKTIRLVFSICTEIKLKVRSHTLVKLRGYCTESHG